MAPVFPILREAGVADLSACAAIVNDYLDEVSSWLPRQKTRSEIEAIFTPDLLEQRTILLVEDVSGPVGYLSLAPEGFVGALYLAPAARGLGLGAKLIAEAKRRNPGGLELTVFEPNRAAQRFYAREGFVERPEARDDETEEGVPTLRYRWSGGAA